MDRLACATRNAFRLEVGPGSAGQGGLGAILENKVRIYCNVRLVNMLKHYLRFPLIQRLAQRLYCDLFTQLRMENVYVHMPLFFEGSNVHSLQSLCYVVVHATES